MFDSSYKSQYIGGQKEKFVRLDDLDSTMSMPTENRGMKKCRFNLWGLTFGGGGKINASKSLRVGMIRGSEGILTFGRSLRTGVTRAVFPEDLKVSDTMIFDPQNRSLLLWNKFFVLSCILSVAVDPLFLYLPVSNYSSNCVAIDEKLGKTATIIRTVIDIFYLIRMAFQFRTAYVAPSSRVFGRGELVIDFKQIAKRYLTRFFIADFLSVLPLPQVVVWRFLYRSKNSEVLATKQALLYIVLIQFIPRSVRFVPLISELKRQAGSFADGAMTGAAFYLLLYLLCSHVFGAFWYILAIERNTDCWQFACKRNAKCDFKFLYCGNRHMKGYNQWRKISDEVLGGQCDGDKFNFGIYSQAVQSRIIDRKSFSLKFCYCLWWGLQNLSTLGQGLQTSTYEWEIVFSIFIAISGLILFALLIGNMQTYLQSLTVRLEEMRIKRRDSELWMHHRGLPQELRERVRRYDQYKWLETRGVDEESLVRNLPKDLRRDIKRHLCLNLVRRVPLFANMDERLLDAICERLKPTLYTEQTYIVREGDPVNEMLFIIRGRLESVTTDGGRSGFFNRGVLKEGDFCGEELLTWALDPKSCSNLPLSTRTVQALNEVEAFSLEAEELKFVASQFRRLHSRQVQHTFRFYSQQWRTWAACFIQAAWRKYSKRKHDELLRKEEEEQDYNNEYDYDDQTALVGQTNKPTESHSIGATAFASTFARNLRGLKIVASTSSTNLIKPPEPDFNDL